MRSGDTQDPDNLARRVHNPRQDQMRLDQHMSPRRDYNRC